MSRKLSLLLIYLLASVASIESTIKKRSLYDYLPEYSIYRDDPNNHTLTEPQIVPSKYDKDDEIIENYEDYHDGNTRNNFYHDSSIVAMEELENGYHSEFHEFCKNNGLNECILNMGSLHRKELQDCDVKYGSA